MSDHPQIKAISSLLHRLNKTHTFNWVYDNEEDNPTMLKGMTHSEQMYEMKDCITAVDNSSLSIKNKETGDTSVLFIVLGNNNYDLVCDWTTGDDSLDDIITAHSEYWENK